MQEFMKPKIYFIIYTFGIGFFFSITKDALSIIEIKRLSNN